MALKQLLPDGMGAKQAPVKQKRKRTNRRSDAERLAGEPWRASGYGAAYRKSRQAVIERQQGKCALTGKVVAEKLGGTWRIVEPGAGVHHRVALCDGGTDDPSNLVLLSARAHALVDAQRRRDGLR